jgi:DNA-directed RNA polymerase beta subunit
LEKVKKTIMGSIFAVTPGINTVDTSRGNLTQKYVGQSVNHENTQSNYLVSPHIDDFMNDGYSDIYTKYAPSDGYILGRVENMTLFIDTKTNKVESFYTPEFQVIYRIGMKIKFHVDNGKVKKGDLLYTYVNYNRDAVLPKIGYRTKTAWLPFLGYNTEDSMVVSESFAKRMRIKNVDKIFIPVSHRYKYNRPDTEVEYSKKVLPQIGEMRNSTTSVINYMPFDFSQNHQLSEINNIANSGHNDSFLKTNEVFIGNLDRYKIYDVKVHKINSDSMDDLKIKYENANKDFFKEIEEIYTTRKKKVENELNEIISAIVPDSKSKKFKEIKDQYTQEYFFLPELKGETEIVNFLDNMKNKHFPAWLEPTTDFIIEINVCNDFSSVLGDKITHLYAGKGVISKIIPDKDMLKDENGEVIDVIFNPLGLPGRMNWQVLIEGMFGLMIEDIEKHIDDDKAFRERIEFIVNHYYPLEFGEENEVTIKSREIINDPNLYELFKENVRKHGLTVYMNEFMNLKGIPEITKKVSRIYEDRFGINVTRKQKLKIPKSLVKKMFDDTNDNTSKNNTKFLLDMDFGKGDINVEAYVGNHIFMKFFHVAIEKYNIINLSQKYNRITGNPNRGKRENGGVHLSWQSKYAMKSHDVWNMIKEFYGPKSDITNKKEFIRSAISGKVHLKDKYNNKMFSNIKSVMKSMFGFTIKND